MDRPELEDEILIILKKKDASDRMHAVVSLATELGHRDPSALLGFPIADAIYEMDNIVRLDEGLRSREKRIRPMERMCRADLKRVHAVTDEKERLHATREFYAKWVEGAEI